MGLGKSLDLIKKVFLKPEKTIAEESKAKKFPYSQSLLNFSLPGLLMSFIIFIYLLVADLGSGMGRAVGVILVPAATFVLWHIFQFVLLVIYNFAAKLMGGKGSFAKTYSLMSINSLFLFSIFLFLGLIYVAFFAITVGSFGLLALPLMPVIYVFMFALYMYVIYVLVLFLKSTHGLSALKACFAYSIAVVIIFTILAILMLILMVVLIGMTFGAVLTSAGAMA